MMRVRPLLLAVSIALAAGCQPTATPSAPTAPVSEDAAAAQAPVGASPAPPAATDADASPWDEARRRGVAFKGLGTEPFWSLEVDGGATPDLRLDLDMGERKLRVPAAHALAPGDGADAGYAGEAEDGSPVTLRIRRAQCSDGMSDRVYPAAITLAVGPQTYEGCGIFLQE